MVVLRWKRREIVALSCRILDCKTGGLVIFCSALRADRNLKVKIIRPFCRLQDIGTVKNTS